MIARVPSDAQEMKSESIEALQDLIAALKDSVNYHLEAAEKIDDDFVAKTFHSVAVARNEIYESISGMIMLADEKPVEEGTWKGSLRTIWTAFRAGLNSGDATVVLIEAERAEDVIMKKFKDILPQIAGNPVNDLLMKHFETVKSGHDRVLSLRNAYQNA